VAIEGEGAMVGATTQKGATLVLVAFPLAGNSHDTWVFVADNNGRDHSNGSCHQQHC